MSKATEALKKKLRTKAEPPPAADYALGLSTGSTLLNLACSGRRTVGFVPGSFIFMVGDSASGKTWIAMSAFAEACLNEKFSSYKLIFDNPENGALMDLRRYFGNAAAERIVPPTDDAKQGSSGTVEEFYFNVERSLNDGPCLYVLDSMDALTTEDERDKFAEVRKAHEKGKETSGSYGTSKAKLNSSYLRVVFNRLRETGSILIVLCQTRDNIGFGAQFNPKTRGGGHALTFYATLELWTSIAGHVKKTVRGKPRELGILCKARVKKNRLTGRDRTVQFPILHSFGIDDLGSLIAWQVEEGHWTESKGRIEASEFDFNGTAEQLVALLERDDREDELRLLVAANWQDLEDACSVERKARYA